MSLEQNVADLVTATTELTEAVNIKKATLDASVSSAQTSEAGALRSEETALQYANAAQAAQALSETAKTAAQVAESNAVAVVTGGTASLDPEAGKIPLADAEGKIDLNWLGPEVAAQLVGGLKSVSTTVWDQNSDEILPTSASGPSSVHLAMRRCTLLDSGEVNYYLSPHDSTLKFDGTPAVLDGTDGQVMVEIPKCYAKATLVLGGADPIYEWALSVLPRPGYVLHPAFVLKGDYVFSQELGMGHYVNITEVCEYVYLSAYDACVQKDGVYIDGLNLDSNTARVTPSVDKLGSVSGRYPMVGLSVPEFSELASNRGAGWEQLSFWVHSLTQLLFVTEYSTLNTQAKLGQGNTQSSYGASSEVQEDSAHTISGKSNSIGNSSGGFDSTLKSTAWVSYRGIENWFGNCYSWVAGVNISDRSYLVKESPPYTVNTATGYINVGTGSDTNGYIRNTLTNSLAFIPTSVEGGSSSVAFSDYYYQSTAWRVLRVGGRAHDGANAGGFCWNGSSSAGRRYRTIGARLQYRKQAS